MGSDARGRLLSPLMWERVRFAIGHPGYASARICAHLLVRRLSGRRVLSGPFRGMRLGVAWPHLPTLVGTYELEVQPAIERLASRGFQTIVNVGAADGYYAVGLALRCPQAAVFAFEASSARRARIVQVAEENGVAGRVRVLGTCTPAGLAALLAEPSQTLVVVDVDGGEAGLVDPAAVAGLAGATMLVELHDHIVPDVSTAIRRRFEGTHAIEEYRTVSRVAADFPVHARWPRLVARQWARLAMYENRPCAQSWFLLTPQPEGLR